MIIDIPDHYVDTLIGALMGHGVHTVRLNGFVPAFVHQFSDMYDKLGGNELMHQNYWEMLVTLAPELQQIVWNR